MLDIMKTEPVPRKAIWGQSKLKDFFDFRQFPQGIGQCWCFADQKGQSNLITEGLHKGETLGAVFRDHPEYFHSDFSYFPFIIGLVGPEDHLSLQIHPDDVLAKRDGYPEGKNESWYFIDAEEDARLVFGTQAKDQAQLEQLVREERWNEIIRYTKIKKGDFVYIPAGMIHAMQKGVTVYEVSQATDVTHRLYDYGRVDRDGKPRELNLDRAMECVKYFGGCTQPMNTWEDRGAYELTTYVDNESFKVSRYQFREDCRLEFEDYMLVTVISGSGLVNGHSVKKGDSFLIPWGSSAVEIRGAMEWMVTNEHRK